MDFFLEEKKWGLELLIEGRAIPEHNRRFLQNGPYYKWIAGGRLHDWLLLDFRTNFPTVRYKGKSFKNSI